MGTSSTFLFIKGSEMNQQKFVFSLAWIAALLVAAPAMGQLANHPVQALPLGDAAGSTFVAVQYARGLNTNSLKRNSFAAGVGRAMEKVSFMGMAGYVLDYGLAAQDELTLGANVAVHLLSDANTPVQVSVQGGLGWASINGVLNNTTILNFPIGIVLQGRPSGDATTVTPWVMPRLDIARASIGGISGTSTNFGASAGLGITMESGAGVHLALDYLNVAGGSPFGFALGGHYMVGG